MPGTLDAFQVKVAALLDVPAAASPVGTVGTLCDASAVATPFPHDESWNPSIGDSITPVAFEKYDKPRLRGVTISSASTQMIHSEQMVALDGPIRMFPSSTNANLKQLENKSAFNLADVIQS